MAMKLNAVMKDQVLHKAIAAAFDHRQKQSVIEMTKISRDIWMKLFGEHDRMLKKVPREFLFKVTREPDADLKFFHATLSLNGQRVSISFEKGTPLPDSRHAWGDIGTLNDVALSKRYHDWHDAHVALGKERETARTTLAAMLKGIRTYEQLEKAWPEGRKFYKSLPVDFPHQHEVPAVQVGELNKMLGLAA